jgi:hypothetical protein
MTMPYETKVTVDEADQVLVKVENEIDTEMERYRENRNYEEAGIALLLVAKATVSAARANKIVMDQVVEVLAEIRDRD